MVKILKVSDVKPCLGLATGKTKNLILYGISNKEDLHKNYNFPQLLSKYNFTGTRDYNMALIIIAFYNYCLQNDYYKKFAQNLNIEGTSSNEMFKWLAVGDGKKVKQLLKNSSSFKKTFDTMLQQSPLPGKENSAKRTKIINSFINQASKIKPWGKNGKYIQKLILKMTNGKLKLINEASRKLIKAATDGDYGLIKELVYEGVYIDATNEHGNTILMISIAKGNDKAAEFLIDHNAKLDVVNNMGWNAIMIAAHQNNLKIFDYLVNKGADEKFIDSDYQTALHIVG